MVASRLHLFWGMLLGLSVSLAIVSGQSIVRIAESREPATVDYTGQIRQFSEIGPGGNSTTPHPWVCYVQGIDPHVDPVVQWQTPDGSAVPTISPGFTQATGSELYQLTTGGGPALTRGPDYNSPDGEYCCVITTVPDQRRCVTLTTCPMLPVPGNGRITYDPANNVATLRCDPGYVLSGTDRTTCQSNNTWSETNVVICSGIRCPQLLILDNGQVIVTSRSLGSIATYTCNIGYTLSGAEMRMCVQKGGRGQWSQAEPSCQPVAIICPKLTILDNGQVTVNTRTVGGVATYTCNNGYTLFGEGMRTCVQNGTIGQWTPAQPLCQRIIRIAESRKANYVDYTGQVRQFSEIGRDGPTTVTPRPWVCYVGSFAAGYVQWQWPNGSVVPTIPSGFTQASGNELYQKYIGSGPALIRGPDYNSLDGEYCCVIATVPDQRRCVTLTTCPTLPSPANGRITYDPATNVATHSCDPGYAPSNTDQRTCQSNNQWSGTTVTCERIMCPTLSNPENGQVTVNTRTVGSVANYTCNNGFTLNRAEMRTCVQNGVIGQWISGEPTCALCPLHTLTNGTVTYSMSDPLPIGTVATYSCDTGYVMTGNRMRLCEEGTAWTGSLPVCNIVDCGALTNPLNGQVDTSFGTTYNQVATYSCDIGYNLVGPPTRACQANAKWSSITPVCEFNPLSLTAQTVYDFNNSVVSISLIGEGDSALTCHTELITCCREQDNPSGGALGEWIGPDSNQIPESSSTSRFYVTRQQSSISLNHGGNSIVRGQYCCVIPRTGGETTFCVQVQMDESGSGTPASSGTTVGLSVAIAVILVVSLTTIITLVIVLIISRMGTRTQQHHSKQQTYELPDQPVYEDMDMGGAGDHTHKQNIELRQCQAYVPKEVLTEKERRGDLGKEGGN